MQSIIISSTTVLEWTSLRETSLGQIPSDQVSTTDDKDLFSVICYWVLVLSRVCFSSLRVHVLQL